MTPSQMAATHAAAFTNERPWSEGEFATFLANPLCFAIGDARAFALARAVADESELLTIATHPGHRRQGLARALMEQWLAEAQARGAARVFLEVASDNAAALALYDDFGFATDGCRKGYYARRDDAAADALLMSRALAGG